MNKRTKYEFNKNVLRADGNILSTNFVFKKDEFTNSYCYLDGFCNNNPDVLKYVASIYPRELTLNKANQHNVAWI